jgi:hypothetical protein
MQVGVFVIVSTIGFYILLRKYKRSITQQSTTQKNKLSNIIYLLYIPVVVLLSYYLFGSQESIQVPTQVEVISRAPSTELLTIPYPESLSSSV